MYEHHPDWPAHERRHAFEVLSDVLGDLHNLTGLEAVFRERFTGGYYCRDDSVIRREAALASSSGFLENYLPLLPPNLALVNGGRTFAAAKATVQPRPEFVADAASVPGSKQTTTNSGAMLLNKKENK